ncbi:hypothetical protein RSAG8_12175, partial [Rhizoctonia solani AG-8 WAC10335]
LGVAQSRPPYADFPRVSLTAHAIHLFHPLSHSCNTKLNQAMIEEVVHHSTRLVGLRLP